MKNIRYIILILFISQVYGQVTDYLWPVGDGVTQIGINGLLNEYRDVSGRWLHDGIDIQGTSPTTVYPVDDGTVDLIIPATQANNYNGGVRLSHTSGTGATFYFHIIPDPSLLNNQAVDVATELGTTNSLNHVHFSEGDDESEINPLQIGHIYPFDDYQNNNDEFPEFVNSGFPANYNGDWEQGITIMENIGNSFNAGGFTGFSTNSSGEFIINGLNRDVDFVVKARDQIFETDGAATPLSSENLGIYYYWAEVYKYNTIIGTVSSDDNINFKSSIFILQLYSPTHYL